MKYSVYDIKVDNTMEINSGILTYAATKTLNFDLITGTYQTMTLTGNVSFITSNLQNGRSVTIRLITTSNRNLTFPVAWKFIGDKPIRINAGKVGILSILSFGTTNDDVVVGYAEER